jgi:hypothetical protein
MRVFLYSQPRSSVGTPASELCCPWINPDLPVVSTHTHTETNMGNVLVSSPKNWNRFQLSDDKEDGREESRVS